MPLAAVIDHDIFCVHGGIPRPMQGSSSRVQDIMTVPSVAGVCPPNELEHSWSQDDGGPTSASSLRLLCRNQCCALCNS
eukprot:10027-Heterococcus_DN1.PRE.3